ncbi:MAG TPA: DUF1707 domain-containing protein [Pseudonocardiaceae bacterium]
MTGEIDPRDLLVSDAEREHIGGLLQKAVGQGRITIAEFDERMAAAMAARTRGDLNVLVMDIAEPTGGPAAPGAEPVVKGEVKLRSGMGDITRRGYWLVPAVVKVNSGMGSVLLDFTEAELTAPVTTIDAVLGVGDLTVVVPEGAAVDVDEAHAGVGEVKNRTGRPVPGAPRFVVRGTSRMGDIKVVNPRVWRLGPLAVHRPFRLTWGQ